jgi:integration host factor subunit beta
MNRSDLIEQIAELKGVSQKQSEDVVNTVFDEIAAALRSADRVEIRGFGSFSVREYESFVGRNPKTGVLVTISAKKNPHFKVGKDLKERIAL